jgi:diguanylate cyclase (GGDEF)-like protein
MSITLVDWSVPIAIALCGLGFIVADLMGLGTALWGYALCSLGFGYAVMLVQTDVLFPAKQILEDNAVLIGVILACRALNARQAIDNFLSLEIAALLTVSAMVAISLLLFHSVRLETFFVMACCGVMLWRSSLAYAKSIETTADRILAGAFLFLSMAIAFQCVLYLWVPNIGGEVGQWRTSVWGSLVQYTGLFGSIILAFAVMIATSSDFIEHYRVHANTDPLTGLLNRRGLETLLATSRGHAFRGRTAAVLLADIDHFKSINDRFGHPFGDVVIVGFGTLLKALAGPRARVVRLGGEEFAVLFPHLTLDVAMSVADKMRRLFAAHPWPQEADGARFSASFGVTPVREGEPFSASLARCCIWPSARGATASSAAWRPIAMACWCPTAPAPTRASRSCHRQGRDGQRFPACSITNSSSSMIISAISPSPASSRASTLSATNSDGPA